MEVKSAALFFFGLGILNVLSVNTVVGEGALESRLNTLEERFTKMEALFEGFSELCATLKNIKSSFGGDSDATTETPDTLVVADDVKAFGDSDRTIFIARVSSDGIQPDDTLNVTVAFQITEEHGSVWFYRHENSSTSRLSGQTQEVDNGSGRTDVVVTALLHSADSLELLSLIIFTYHNEVQLNFDIHELFTAGQLNMQEELEYKVTKYNPIISIPDTVLETEGILIPLEVSENVVERLNYNRYALSNMFYTVNTSTTPTELVQAFNHPDIGEVITAEVKNGSNNEIVVGIDKAHAQNGGVLNVRVSQTGQGYLESIEYGYTIRIINQEVKGFAPPGTIAIPKTDDVKYYYGEYYSFVCTAAGTPPPDISILKVKKDGSTKQLLADEDGSTDFMRIKALNFVPETIGELEGAYICRSTNGNSTVDSKTSIAKLEFVAYDLRKTGVMKNTNEGTTISCKAMGVPTPILELRKNGNYGDDLLATMKHKVSTKAKTTRVTVTISPPDPSIDYVVCVAKQRLEQFREVKRFHDIKINHD